MVTIDLLTIAMKIIEVGANLNHKHPECMQLECLAYGIIPDLKYQIDRKSSFQPENNINKKKQFTSNYLDFFSIKHTFKCR